MGVTPQDFLRDRDLANTIVAPQHAFTVERDRVTEVSASKGRNVALLDSRRVRIDALRSSCDRDDPATLVWYVVGRYTPAERRPETIKRRGWRCGASGLRR